MSLLYSMIESYRDLLIQIFQNISRNFGKSQTVIILCLVNLRDLHSCALNLQVMGCKLELKIKEWEGSRTKSHMNETGSLQPQPSCYNLLQTLPTQFWCSTNPCEGLKFWLEALISSLWFLPSEKHTQFDLMWYRYLPRGKPQIPSRVHTKSHNNMQRDFSLTNPTYPICLWKNCMTSVKQTQ